MDTRVKIGNPRHTFEMGVSAGMNAAVEAIRALPENLRATPGLQLALATVTAVSAETRANAVSRNLALLARNGVDVATHRAVSYDPSKDELICEFYTEQEVE